MKINYKMLLYFGIGALIIYIFFKPIMYLLAFVLFMLGMAFKTIKESFLDGIVYINANILYSTIIIAIIALIGIFFILKRFIKPKKILLYTLIILIPCLIFLRIIPDYSNDFGINITHIFNYNKYNQGYCLKENRILSKEERFKRGIREYVIKSLEANKMIDEYRCLEADMDAFCGYLGNPPYGKNSLKVGYYKLLDIKTEDLIKTIPIKYQEFKGNTYKNILFNTFDAKLTNPKDYLRINLKDMTAGFSVPFVRYTGALDFDLYVDKSFILYDNFSFVPNTMFVSDLLRGIFHYETYLYLLKREIKPNWSIKIDNCGNMDFNVERYYKENRVNEAG